MQKKTFKSNLIMWSVLLGVLLWLAGKVAMCFDGFRNISGFEAAFMETIRQPFTFRWMEYTGAFLIVAIAGWFVLLATFTSFYGKYMSGKEHGSSDWGDPKKIGKELTCDDPDGSAIVSQNVMINMDCQKHGYNDNTLVIGGPGSGKSRFFVKPNILQCNANYVITDPAGELLRSCGGALEKMGYKIVVLNLIDMAKSNRYNPFRYIRNDTDVLKLITNLIKNTTPSEAKSNDPFWEKAETALLQAIMFYLWHEAPVADQNFSTVMYLLDNSIPKEDNENYVSPLDLVFRELEMNDPEHIAVKQYKIYKKAAGKTAKSILVSCQTRLSVFNVQVVADLTSVDELEIEKFATEKRALFCIIPETDSTFNFLIGMLYTQIMQTLYDLADNNMTPGRVGKLKYHLRFLMDEFGIVAIPEDFTKYLNSGRKREISFNMIIQNFGQLQKIFNKEWEGIMDSCSTMLYLGSNGKETHKYMSDMLGDATIDYLTSGKNDSHLSQNKNITGRKLMTPDEVRRMKKKECLVFIGSELPIKDNKYDLDKHKNVGLTCDKGAPPYRFGVVRGRSLAAFAEQTNLNNYVFASEEVS